MSAIEKSKAQPSPVTDQIASLLKQYGCGPIHFSGSDGFYERHLVFDGVKEPETTSPREHFEAFARSIRDVLSQRWVATEKTYQQQKRRDPDSPEPGFLVVCNFDSSNAQRIAIDLGPILKKDGPFICHELLSDQPQTFPHPQLDLLLPPSGVQVLEF